MYNFTLIYKVLTWNMTYSDISWEALENTLFLNIVCTWTSVVTHFGLYIFSLYGRMEFVFHSAVAAARLTLICFCLVALLQVEFDAFKPRIVILG